ncbi:MAG: disulfide reductase, partial [Proteobacteria bacterium]|nr:disulfide reductase [Pseudomonadota bacterium]
KCRVCEKVCPVDAIDYEQKETFVQEEVGAIVVATGFDLYPLSQIGEYGSGSIPDVVDGLAFERLLSASGPTTG